MKVFIFLICFLILPAAAQTFLPGTDDIPQMAALQNVEETASFDNPAERMVLVGAETALSSKKVLQFYKEALTNLGWVEKRAGKFERGTDSFSIEITPNGKLNQIQFRLSQRNL